MGKITLLDNALANMIAAGEVIERPSSVIKELVENSIDAKATSIEVVIYDGGRTRIVVTDNGEGMDKDDALLALKRHATSKIKTEFDLFRIKTLGFRGEALPSISAVSTLTLTTATSDGIGTCITAHEDEIEVKEASSRQGTTITVSELFYNTPARLKYLKNDYVENASSLEVISRLALGHPEIAFSFAIDDKVQFTTSGRGVLLEAIMDIFGSSVASNMVEISYSCPDFEIGGYIGKPDIARSNRYYMISLLNGRSVYMPKIQASIIEAYRDFLPPVRFPFVILEFKIDPSLLDVNVHPSKREIRFSKEPQLKVALVKQIEVTLRQAILTAKITERIKPTTYQASNDDMVNANMSIFEDTPAYATIGAENQYPAQATKEQLVLTAISQIHRTYIIASDDEGGFVLIDQHAAAERINYEKFKAIAASETFTSKPLIPLIITLKPSEDALMTQEKRQLLHETGIDLVPFGIRTYQVNEIPVWAKEYDERAYVEELIDQVLHQDTLDVVKVRDEAIASKSCKRSLKANQSLNIVEMQQLIDDLLKTNNPFACPHGRPTIVEFSKYQLEKMFKRTGF